MYDSQLKVNPNAFQAYQYHRKKSNNALKTRLKEIGLDCIDNGEQIKFPETPFKIRVSVIDFVSLLGAPRRGSCLVISHS